MLQLRRGNLHTAKISPALAHVVITRQGVKREGVSIQVILKIKDAGESCARKFRLVPGSIRILLLQKPGHSAFDTRIVRTAGCEQPDQAPGRLRCSALTFALPRRVVVGTR